MLILQEKKPQLIDKDLLGKWIWRIGLEMESLKKMVVTTKYGRESIWFPKAVRRGHGRRIWKSILKGKDGFKSFIKFKLGLIEWIKFRSMFGVGILLLVLP